MLGNVTKLSEIHTKVKKLIIHISWVPLNDILPCQFLCPSVHVSVCIFVYVYIGTFLLIRKPKKYIYERVYFSKINPRQNPLLM